MNRRGSIRSSARASLALGLVLVGWVALGNGCKNSERMSAGTSAGASAATSAAVSTSGAAAARVAVAVAEGRSVPFRVEVARTSPEREQGLMYREHLDADAGMIFIFERPAPLTFWMKNTLIPLDMIFIDSDRRVRGIVENAEPGTLTERRVDGLSEYVLEINGGLSGKLGIQPGAKVDFSGVPGF